MRAAILMMFAIFDVVAENSPHCGLRANVLCSRHTFQGDLVYWEFAVNLFKSIELKLNLFCLTKKLFMDDTLL
jgi:hypothetical protein